MTETTTMAPGLPANTAERFDTRKLDAAFFDDPYPVYADLRANDPVHHLPGGGVFLTRHADILQVYRDKRCSSEKKVEFKPKFGDGYLYEHHTTSLVFNDPPLHTKVRKIIAGALTPRALAAREPDIVALVDTLLDAMALRDGADIITDYAAAIPVEVIGNLLGVPTAEREPLRGWSLAILGALEPSLTAEQFQRGEAAVRDFLAFLEQLVADRRRAMGDPETDVLSRLIAAEETGERLSEKELLHNCIFLLNAGHETTTNLIGNGLHALMRFRDQWDRLLAKPALIESAVEELLRFESPVQFNNRRTTETIAVGGVRLAPDTEITLCIGAANRDPAMFEEPDRLDIARRPNPHLAFGADRHICAGLTLARIEGRIAIDRFIRRFPQADLRDKPVRDPRARFRGFQALPVTLAAGGAGVQDG